MSATAAFLLSCHSNILGVVQKVDIKEVTSDADKAAIEEVEPNNKDKKVYEAKNDPDVLYAVNDDDEKKTCTAILKKDNSTVYGSIGSDKVGGTPEWTVNKIGSIKADEEIKNLTLDSWDENTAIEKTTNAPDLDDFKAINVDSEAKVENLKFIPENKIYDDSARTVYATKESKKAFKEVKNNELYVSNKDTWVDLVGKIMDPPAFHLGTGVGNFTIETKDKDDQWQAFAGDINDTVGKSIGEGSSIAVRMSFKPNENNKYYSEGSTEVEVYPLSKFGEHVLKLCDDDFDENTAKNGFAKHYGKLLNICVSEYSKLSDDDKDQEEVEINDQTLTPKSLLSYYSRLYMLYAAVRDLCEKKNDANPSSCTEKDILESKSLSSEDKQYLINMIYANYDKLDDLYGDEVKAAAASVKDDLIKSIENISSSDSDNSSKGNSSGGSSSGSNGSSGSRSSVGSSGGGYYSGGGGGYYSSGRSSAAIKTGSESLSMLLSSFGLSSGALFSFRKRKND